MIVNALTRWIGKLVNRSKVAYDEVPHERLLPALRHPYVRQRMIECSILEEAENPYYKNLLDLRSSHTVGSFPSLLVGDDDNDELEEEWLSWGMENGIGKILRELRREASKTGVGIAIPYEDLTKSNPLCYQIVPSIELQQPRQAMDNDRIIDGIEFDENWNPIKIYLGAEAKEYDLDRDGVLFWAKGNPLSKQLFFPECVAAFSIYPSVRQFLAAVIEAEKFSAAIPMAVELDPKVYGQSDVTPTGKLKYEPGFIPTLPPGTKLTGINTFSGGKDREKTMRLMVAAGARCMNCPVNLALGDSSGSNMSSAQVDLQLWKTETENDRFDFMPVYFKVFRRWYTQRPGFLNSTKKPSVRFASSVIFEHPDPVKNANSRAIDLISGSRTLHMIYNERSRNPRTEMRKEAKLLGITLEELQKLYVATRTNKILEILERLDANSRNEDRE
jgi:hypothetical protein